mmetsp:Transcript_17807/g.69046  ORF Transcript_17807/g.69046 Transcript_17807/m.69046 type:complete len:249 (-) Transcript_17807:948-1694(-)
MALEERLRAVDDGTGVERGNAAEAIVGDAVGLEVPELDHAGGDDAELVRVALCAKVLACVVAEAWLLPLLDRLEASVAHNVVRRLAVLRHRQDELDLPVGAVRCSLSAMPQVPAELVQRLRLLLRRAALSFVRAFVFVRGEGHERRGLDLPLVGDVVGSTVAPPPPLRLPPRQLRRVLDLPSGEGIPNWAPKPLRPPLLSLFLLLRRHHRESDALRWHRRACVRRITGCMREAALLCLLVARFVEEAV